MARSSYQPSSSTRHSTPDGLVDRSARALRGVVSRVRFANPDTGFAIVELRDGSGVKGTIAGAAPGLEFHFHGTWKHDARFGWTFDAHEGAIPLLPTTAAGVVDYLRAHAPWVGAAVARKIVEAFGDDALEVAKSDPARVAAEVPGITTERAAEIARVLNDRAALEAVEVAVRGMVAVAGVNARQVRAILDRYGSEAANFVRANPYRLIDEVEGIGWATADAIAKALGLEATAADRVRAGIMRAMQDREDEGDACAPRARVVELSVALLGIARAVVEEQLVAMVADQDKGESVLVEAALEGLAGAFVWRRATWEAEALIAETVVALLAPGATGDAEAPGEPEEQAAAAPVDAADPLACLEAI